MCKIWFDGRVLPSVIIHPPNGEQIPPEKDGNSRSFHFFFQFPTKSSKYFSPVSLKNNPIVIK
jgi:hypothetical protein